MGIAKPGAVFFASITLVSLALAPSWFTVLPRLDHGVATIAAFAFFSKLCHQRPDRSLIVFGSQTAVCIRCLGIYAGAALGSLLPLKHATAIRTLIAAIVLNCLDVATESLHFHSNLPLLRLLIGGMLGIAAGAMLRTSSEATAVHTLGS